MPSITLSVRYLIIALFMTAAVASHGHIANAGYTLEIAYCSKNADGSGHCNATFAAFQNHSNPNAWVNFILSSDGTRMFQARLNGGFYAANATSPAILAMWDAALSHRGRFFIVWNASSQITHLTLENGSHHSTF